MPVVARADIARTLVAQGIAPERHRDTPYPGTCRALNLSFEAGMSVRLHLPEGEVHWQDLPDLSLSEKWWSRRLSWF